jgi:hypothetical protein
VVRSLRHVKTGSSANCAQHRPAQSSLSTNPFVLISLAAWPTRRTGWGRKALPPLQLKGRSRDQDSPLRSLAAPPWPDSPRVLRGADLH